MPNEEKFKVKTVRLPTELLDVITAIAKVERRTVNNTIQYLLETISTVYTERDDSVNEFLKSFFAGKGIKIEFISPYKSQITNITATNYQLDPLQTRALAPVNDSH